MEIQDVKEMLKSGAMTFEFAESGRITVLERRYNEVDGVPMLRPTQETDSREMEGVVTEIEREMNTYTASMTKRLTDAKDLLKAIQTKEAEREQIKEKAKK